MLWFPRLRPTQKPKYPAGKASDIQGIKMEKLFNERSDRCNEEAKIDFCSILRLVSKWSVQ